MMGQKTVITQTAINFGPGGSGGQTAMFSTEEDAAMRPVTMEIEVAEIDQPPAQTGPTGQMTMFDMQVTFTEAARATRRVK